MSNENCSQIRDKTDGWPDLNDPVHDYLGITRNIHRWAFFSLALGIALWVSGVSTQLGIIIFVIGMLGLVIAWFIH